MTFARLRTLVPLLLLLHFSQIALAQDAKPEKSEPPKVPVEEQIQKLDSELEQSRQKAAASRKEFAELQRQQFDLNLKLKHTESELLAIEASRLQSRQKIESLQKENGTWVSFSQTIAPMLRDRCLNCHNARNPKGQYLVATYTNTVGTGESGPAVIPGQADNSRLYQLLVDHSMPQDSDPLSTVQIEAVRRWINSGARLDSSAQPDESIFRLAPRVEQVTPPDHYPANIPVSAIAISRAGDLIATSGYYEVLLWSQEDKKLVRRIRGVGQRVNAIAFLSDGKQIAVASGTPGRVGEARVFDVNTGESKWDLLYCQDSALCLAVSPDGRRLAVGETSGAITIFSIQQEKFEQLRRIEDHSDWINHLTWSSNSKLLASASRDKTCKVFDAETGKLEITFNGHEQPVNGVLFSEDDKQVISVGEDRRLRIWNLIEAKQVHELKGIDGQSQLLRLDKQKCLVVGREGGALLVDCNDAKKLTQFELRGAIVATGCVGLDPSKVLFGTFEGQIQALDLNQTSKLETLFSVSP